MAAAARSGGGPPAAEPAASAELQWRVAARLLSGELLAELLVRPDSTVGELRRGLVEAAGTKGRLRLVHDGAPLLDEASTLAAASLRDGCNVVAVRSAGVRVVTGNSGGEMGVWSFDGDAVERMASIDLFTGVRSVALSPDGALVAIGLVEAYPGDCVATTSLWRADPLQLEHSWELQGSSCIWRLTFSPLGRSLAACVGDPTYGDIAVWSLETSDEPSRFQCLDCMPTAVAYSPCEKYVAVGGATVVKVWEVSTRKCICEASEHTDIVAWVCFSPDGEFLATASEDRTAVLWSMTERCKVVTLSGHGDVVWCIGFNPSGSRVVTASGDGSAKIWEVADGRCVRTLECPEEDVAFAAFSPDGALIFTGSDCAARVWNAETGRSELEFEAKAPMAISAEA